MIKQLAGVAIAIGAGAGTAKLLVMAREELDRIVIRTGRDIKRRKDKAEFDKKPKLITKQ